ncbi:MAG: hypothetical protein EOP47_23460, partial [Sphingobacteriaceae bacterium]
MRSNPILTSLYFLLFLLIVNSSVAQPAGKPADLKCEYLVNPIGIDAPTPRLTWLLNDNREGAVQKAYSV